MGWVTIIFTGGGIAFVLFLCSVVSIWSKKYKTGLIFAFLEFLPAAAASYAWMYALKVSGKIDWFLFGLFGYTPIAVIFYCMWAAGMICAAVSAQGLASGKKVHTAQA